jgi:hypothetical protein
MGCGGSKVEQKKKADAPAIPDVHPDANGEACGTCFWAHCVVRCKLTAPGLAVLQFLSLSRNA